MPKSVLFKDLLQGTLFLTENDTSDLVLYEKDGDYGSPFDKPSKVRGDLRFRHTRKLVSFTPHHLVYLLSERTFAEKLRQ